MRQEKGVEPSAEEVGTELGTTAEHVEDTIAQLQTAQVLSLDDYLPSDSDDSRKVDVTPNSGIATPEQQAQQRERIEMLAEAILELPDQQQKVLKLILLRRANIEGNWRRTRCV